jgi:phage shock protein PspC (stress-responsive transcriptional regulator)
MKKYYRSRTDRKIAGICGGLGELWSVDPTLIRLGVVFAAFLTALAPMLLAYLAAWIIVPERPIDWSTAAPPAGPGGGPSGTPGEPTA